ncbi:MAG: lysophospholipid acyltransferase family protein [Terrimicrobiaceae bacterium]|nr:lysophospholipid acyltransferase family protein [Terrimicrobiaceae bacterium]
MENFHRFVYAVVVGTCRLILLPSARIRVHILAPVPTGPLVLASNHVSHFDPPIISGCLPRKIEWLGMAGLFGTAWSKKLFEWLDVIPVHRSGDDREAIRQAVRRLKIGRVIGVFPEAGIRDGARSILAGGEIRDGALLLALQSGAPILPVVILGSERLYNWRRWFPWSRANVFVGIGPAIPVPVGLARTESRAVLRNRLLAALGEIRDDLFGRFSLTDDDLPHSPQQRMAEQ